MEKSYWKTDRITDAKLDKFQIALEDNKDDNGSEYLTRKKLIDGLFRLFSNLFYFPNLGILLSFKFCSSVLSNKNDVIPANKLNGCKEFTA